MCVCVYLQSAYDLFQRQDALGASDEGGGGQPEHLVQVGLIQTIEAYMSHDAPQDKRAVEGGAGGRGQGEKKEGRR